MISDESFNHGHYSYCEDEVYGENAEVEYSETSMIFKMENLAIKTPSQNDADQTG